MSLLLQEGFDHYAVALLAAKGWTVNQPVTAPSMVTGRFGAQAVQVRNNTAGNQTSIAKSFTAAATIIAGAACNVTNVLAAINDFFVLRAGATQAVRIGLDASNRLIVRNSGGTLIATGTTVFVGNVFHYIEVKAFMNGASGTVEVHLDGVVEIASTVGNFGSTNLDSLLLEGMQTSTGGFMQFDDVYVCDNGGAAPRNTFLGDVRVKTTMPNADGAHAQWTPDTGVSHFARVDETLADGDTSFVSDATPGDIDTYAIAAIDTAATVFGVQVSIYARKDDANVRQIAPVIRQAGTDNVGTTVTLGSSYAFATQLYNQDPTAADWTPTTVNADEYGVKEIA